MGQGMESQANTTGVRATLQALPLFEAVAAETAERFSAAAQVRKHPKGSVLFLQDDPADYFYVILSGWVKLFRHTSEGDEAVIDMLTENSVFGETSIIEDGHHSFGAVVTDAAELISLPTSLLKTSIEDDNKLALAMLSSLSRHRVRQTKELEGMTLKNASQRIGCFMLRLCNSSDEHDITIKLPYDKSLIAARLGMKSETFSRALNKLRKETNINISGSVVTIPEIDDLSHYACSACSNEFPCSDIK